VIEGKRTRSIFSSVAAASKRGDRQIADELAGACTVEIDPIRSGTGGAPAFRGETHQDVADRPTIAIKRP